ncbi:hypothetical protein ARMGADRAFT_1066713 [Armillaria gallica]|uniref:Uncharacterized protein n=1 Tax=Armillaria gallica TaxID=47427 RepID=A0A2H3D3X1_ARMGA|nr:hypothetical protein ARMGADRAFT_1066713 [Armillaria gallica]
MTRNNVIRVIDKIPYQTSTDHRNSLYYRHPHKQRRPFLLTVKIARSRGFLARKKITGGEDQAQIFLRERSDRRRHLTDRLISSRRSFARTVHQASIKKFIALGESAGKTEQAAIVTISRAGPEKLCNSCAVASDLNTSTKSEEAGSGSS